MHEYLAIGCSHTRAKYLPNEFRWTETISQYTGKEFSYRHTCKIASGLIHLQKRTCDLFVDQSDQVKWLIIQKPQALRFPWWLTDWEDRVSPSRYDKFRDIDLIKGRRKSIKDFKKLKHKERKNIAKLIYAEELKCLQKLRDMFTEAKMSYFHYWGDHVMDLLHYPELSEINEQLGEAMVLEGIENWSMVVKLKDIPSLYDDQNDLNIEYTKLVELGWINGDLHPGPVFHDVILNKVKDWVCLPSLEDKILT